jgi:16S rRNA (guanine1207-N2)-methyltransferase
VSDGHYFDAEPSAASQPGRVRLKLRDGTVELATDRGVFAAGHADAGTLLLLEVAPPPPPSGDLLDLGCGYGAIAVTLARRAPAATVWAVDVNRRALDLTAANAAQLGLANIRTAFPAEVSPSVRFAGIWSNPPIRVGKAALHELLVTWLDRLLPSGRAWLVVQRHLGSDSLASWLGSEGFAASRRTSRRGYRVLEVGPR